MGTKGWGLVWPCVGNKVALGFPDSGEPLETNSYSKYITPLSVVDWIRHRNKVASSASTQWRTLSLSFPMIGKALAWKVGNGMQVRIGSDAIVGFGESIFLEEDLIYSLRMKGLCTLDRIANVEVNTIWR
jgi:hypothetical protein